jgi:hypothetical protein
MAFAMQWLLDNNVATVNGRVVKVEYHGQDMVEGLVEAPTGEYETTIEDQPILDEFGEETGKTEPTMVQIPVMEEVMGYVEKPFVVDTIPEHVVDGEIIPECLVYLPRFA